MTAADEPSGTEHEVGRIPASAGGLVFDDAARLLILKPTYKAGWTVPGGQMEANGESPWEACKREIREESGLEMRSARLACVDFLRPRDGRLGGIRFLFDCGALDGGALDDIRLQAGEISEHRFVDVPTAVNLLSGPLRRRVSAALGASACVYLEDGKRVPGLGSS